MQNKEGHTARGITGAAEIWVAAAIGLACSVAMWRLAITILGLAILILPKRTRTKLLF